MTENLDFSQKVTSCFHSLVWLSLRHVSEGEEQDDLLLTLPIFSPFTPLSHPAPHTDSDMENLAK